MLNTNTPAGMYDYSRGDLVHDELDGRLHRFHSYDGDDVQLMDRNTLAQLPDLRHWSQVMPASTHARLTAAVA